MVYQARQNDYRAGDFLHHRHRHRRHAIARQRRARGCKGADLFRVDDDGGVDYRADHIEHYPARPWHEHRSGALDAGAGIDLCTAGAAADHNRLSAAYYSLPFTGAFVQGDILQVVLISLLFAIGLLTVGDRGKPLLDVIQLFPDVLFRIIGMIVSWPPSVVRRDGVYSREIRPSSRWDRCSTLMLVFYLTCILFVAVFSGVVMRLIGLRIWPLKYLREELMISVAHPLPRPRCLG